jgi:hypothetical protein
MDYFHDSRTNHLAINSILCILAIGPQKRFVQPETYYTPIRHIQFPHLIYKIRAQTLFCKLQAPASAPASLGTHVEVLFL